MRRLLSLRSIPAVLGLAVAIPGVFAPSCRAGFGFGHWCGHGGGWVAGPTPMAYSAPYYSGMVASPGVVAGPAVGLPALGAATTPPGYTGPTGAFFYGSTPAFAGQGTFTPSFAGQAGFTPAFAGYSAPTFFTPSAPTFGAAPTSGGVYPPASTHYLASFDPEAAQVPSEAGATPAFPVSLGIEILADVINQWKGGTRNRETLIQNAINLFGRRTQNSPLGGDVQKIIQIVDRVLNGRNLTAGSGNTATSPAPAVPGGTATSPDGKVADVVVSVRPGIRVLVEYVGPAQGGTSGATATGGTIATGGTTTGGATTSGTTGPASGTGTSTAPAVPGGGNTEPSGGPGRPQR